MKNVELKQKVENMVMNLVSINSELNELHGKKKIILTGEGGYFEASSEINFILKTHLEKLILNGFQIRISSLNLSQKVEGISMSTQNFVPSSEDLENLNGHYESNIEKARKKQEELIKKQKLRVKEKLGLIQSNLELLKKYSKEGSKKELTAVLTQLLPNWTTEVDLDELRHTCEGMINQTKKISSFFSEVSLIVEKLELALKEFKVGSWPMKKFPTGKFKGSLEFELIAEELIRNYSE